MTGFQLVISDGHREIQTNVSTAFLGDSWQMCQFHTTRAVLRNVPKKDQQEIATQLREANVNEQRLQDCADDLTTRGYRKAANTIERFLPGLLNYTAFPKAHRKRIRTTNVMERVNKELKRRTRVVGVFPSDQSLLRLAGSILKDINEEWITGKRWLPMGERQRSSEIGSEGNYSTSETLPKKTLDRYAFSICSVNDAAKDRHFHQP